MSKIDTYFEKKGIKTIFNCLGANETLTRAYVGNYYKFVDNNSKQSQHEKLKIYNQLYDIIPREKKTGFENLQTLDRQFRNDIQKYIIESQFTPLDCIGNDEHDSSLNYKNALIEFVKTVENPLLYISGGADSEVMARAFLQSGNKAKFVIFEWLNNGKHIINAQEVFHAYRFCKRFNIVPIIQQVNVEELWSTEDFKKLAIELQIESPQIATYAYIIKHMDQMFPSCTHVFGGEVRFRTNYIADNGLRSNLIYLEKQYPSFQNCYYIASEDGFGFGATASIALYFAPNGTWNINGNNLTPQLGCPTSGTYAYGSFDPFQIEIQTCVISGGGAGVDPENGCTPWYIIGVGIQVASVQASSNGGSSSISLTTEFSVQYRDVGSTGPGIGGNPTLIAQAFN